LWPLAPWPSCVLAFWQHTTEADSINPEGVIAGQFVDAGYALRGFLRGCDGVFTTFDVPNAGTGYGQGTAVGGVDGLNPEGDIGGL
jgi:hypothetical protein